MFNKLFFVLASSLLITLSSPSVAKEPTYHTILGSGGTKYKVFGTEQTARTILNELTSEGSERLQDLRTAQYVQRCFKVGRMRVCEPTKRLREVPVRKTIKNDRSLIYGLGRLKMIEERKKNDLRRMRVEEEKMEMYKKQKKQQELKLAKKKQQLVKKIINVSKKYKWEKDKPKNPNIIKSITKGGLVRTLHCNPGPCTTGSVKLHENISGIEMGVTVNALAKWIKANAAQRKPKDNTNKNNTETAEDTASLEDVSLGTMFAEVEADLEATNDTNLTRALSITIEQVTKNKETYKNNLKKSMENVNPLQGVGDEVPWWLVAP